MGKMRLIKDAFGTTEGFCLVKSAAVRTDVKGTEYLDMVCVDPLGNLITTYQVTEHFPVLVNMKVIQMWLGHSSMKTTSDCYSHLEASAKERAGEVLSSILGADQDCESEEE
jgi:hypothetical protein